MKYTCFCGASIEVSSMYVATERIEWDRFRKDHEGCKPKQRERVAFVPMYTVQCDSAGRAESLVFTKCDMCHLPLAFCRCRRRCASECLADDGFEKWFTERGIAILASSLDKNISWHRMARAAWDASRKNT